jgi:D-sedoheptulose 7-phosphate isomerase
MSDRRSHITDYLKALQGVLTELSVDEVETVIGVFEQAYRDDRTIFICGNGGSATTASHWVCDFSKGTVSPAGKRIRMYSVGDNMAMLTAYANDVNYESVFSEPLKTYVRPGDVVLLLTASGNSPNVLAAAETAREMGATTVGLIGFGGGKLAKLVDHQIMVNCREYGPVEDLHLILDHIISLYMRKVVSASTA